MTRTFSACAQFRGHRPGYVFQRGDQGTGYYPDAMWVDANDNANDDVSGNIANGLANDTADGVARSSKTHSPGLRTRRRLWIYAGTAVVLLFLLFVVVRARA